MSKLIFLIHLFLLSIIEVNASEVSYLVRSPHALLMGDAYTALADDEYTLFYNPAALSRNRGLEFYMINPDLGGVNALDEMDRFTDVPSEPSAIAERFMGFPVYLKLGATPGIKFGPFGLSLFANTSTNFVIRNQVHPVMDIDFKLDRGFVLGYAHTFGTAKKAGDVGSRTSFGLSFKSMNRQSIDESYDLFGLELLNKIAALEGAAEADAIRETLGYSYGTGYGGDLGFLWSYDFGVSEVAAGLSILDVIGTTFSKVEGTSDIPDQEMITSAGVSWSQDFWIMDYRVAFDLHPLLHDIDLMRKVHVGFDIGLPLIRVMAGFNGGYLSYGARIKLWPFTLTAGFYGVELGSTYKQEEGSRFVLYLSLLDFSFDA